MILKFQNILHYFGGYGGHFFKKRLLKDLYMKIGKFWDFRETIQLLISVEWVY